MEMSMMIIDISKKENPQSHHHHHPSLKLLAEEIIHYTQHVSSFLVFFFIILIFLTHLLQSCLSCCWGLKRREDKMEIKRRNNYNHIIGLVNRTPRINPEQIIIDVRQSLLTRFRLTF